MAHLFAPAMVHSHFPWHHGCISTTWKAVFCSIILGIKMFHWKSVTKSFPWLSCLTKLYLYINRKLQVFPHGVRSASALAIIVLVLPPCSPIGACTTFFRRWSHSCILTALWSIDILMRLVTGYRLAGKLFLSVPCTITHAVLILITPVCPILAVVSTNIRQNHHRSGFAHPYETFTGCAWHGFCSRAQAHLVCWAHFTVTLPFHLV